MRKPSLAAAILGALLVLGSPIGGIGALILGADDSGAFVQSLGDAGLWAFVVLGVAGFAALVSAVLVFLAARGKRVPAVLGLSLGLLPWVAGLAGMRVGAGFAAAGAESADAASRAVFLAQGISEATTARLFGATMSAALLGCLAIAWAMASIGQRAENRSGWLALPFAFLGLVGLAVPVLVLLTAPVSGLSLLLLSGGAAALTLMLAAAGAGGDEPHGRAAALSAGAVVAALLGGFTAVEAIATRGVVEVFASVANVDAAGKLRFLVTGSMEVVTAERGMLLGGLALVFAAACVIAWSLTRARPSAGRIAGAILAVAVVALAVVADRFTMGAVGDELDRVAQPPWAALQGFEPAQVGGTDRSAVQAVVTLDRFQVLATSESLQLTTHPDPSTQPALAGVLRNLPADPWLSPDESRSLALGIDRRVGAPVLRTITAAARDAGYGAVVLVGLPATPPVDEETSGEIRTSVPYLAWALRDTGAVRIDLQPSDPLSSPLTLGDTDTAQSLIAAADQLTAAGRRPVLATVATEPAEPQILGQLLPAR